MGEKKENSTNIQGVTQSVEENSEISIIEREEDVFEECYAYDHRELLHIIEKGYVEPEDDEEDEVRWVAKGINIDNVQELLQVIEQAKKEEWEELYLTFTCSLEIPVEIGKLKNLKRLQIDNESVDRAGVIKLPSTIGELEGLEEFLAYGCNMESLPKEFSKLKNLKNLNLNNNNFLEFPKEILMLYNLESLAINYKYETIPDEICELKNLKYLYMPNARVSSLPENIGNLTELEILCIWGTQIKHLPESCTNLLKIKSLYLTRSIFEHILPPEIISQSPLEAINYIVRYQTDQKMVEINESKMIIVGQGGVGKTCILNRLIYDKYDETITTEGIDIAPWEFEFNKKKYKLNVWDFGGQEIYHATHQFFLTNRSLYIFVWDARQEEEYGRIDYWLHTIESFASNSPIIIVVNKCDSRNSIKQLDLKSIKERFPQIIDSYKVSCKENVGIEELRNVIKEETIKLPLMGMVWLSSWLEVRVELEQLAQNRNIIDYAEYREICLKHNIFSNEALSLSKYLHDLGIIINFQNDLYLKNIVILNPDWGTKAVYKVLDAQENILKNRNGTLYVDDLEKIWEGDAEYPADTYPIILRLMENFQLSFEVKKNTEYLVAELLETEEMEIEIDKKGKHVLNFQYNYEFMPAGIMTRFIVKANTYLLEKDNKKVCWKKGAYLKYEDAVAIVKLFNGIAERKIEITIVGEDSRNNRELLVIVRKYFEEIHNSIPKLKYTEHVRCNCSPNCAYLHDYQYLIKLEKEGIVEERCRETLIPVEVSKLLDGVTGKREKKHERNNVMANIEVNPQIIVQANNTNDNKNSNINSVQNTITIEIRSSINELQGGINDLKDEVVYENAELEKDFGKLEKSLKLLDSAETKDEVVKSGALNKVKRFLEEVQDVESELGKVVKTLKHGMEIVQGIGEKYNSIAEWCGLPVIPKILLKI